MINLTNLQAREFLLLKQGLLGDYRFVGKEGSLDFIRQAGCVQFDPVDACGRNADLTLQSRIKDFSKQTLYELLYEDRRLFDYPDKNLSLIPLEDWPYFERYRQASREKGLSFEGLAALEKQAKKYIEANGPVNSNALPIMGTINWHSIIHWSGNRHGRTKAARSVLEQLYSTGELIIHHREGTRKYYDLACKHIPLELLAAPDPLEDEFEHQKWRVLRRIGAVGLLWNRASDAWLYIWKLNSGRRNEIIKELLKEGKILAIRVEGLKDSLFCRQEDFPLVKAVLAKKEFKRRCELIAPLDCLMWDRQLIRALFNFEYAWEIYTPVAKRKYGYYVLPLLYGNSFIGRLEAVSDKKAGILAVKNIWYEDGVKQTDSLRKAIVECVGRLAAFNGCAEYSLPAKLQCRL